MAFASYVAAGLLSPLYLPVLMVFSNADVTLVYSFLKDTVLGDLPRVLTMVRLSRGINVYSAWLSAPLRGG